MTEDQAREVLLLQAVEAAGDNPDWSLDDRAWASRLAQQTAGSEPEAFIVARAGHALQRLLPRDAAARRWLAQRTWRRLWPLLGAMLGFMLGAAVDHIGAPQRVDLLAPPVWAVVAWNLVVYLGLLVPHRASGLRRWLARRWAAGEAGVALLWARQAAPLSLARAALVLHGAAAALALGLVTGMYLRGLVLDYRAGWQSTFLEAPFVQSLLGALLAPASAITGIAVPDVAPLRLTPGAAAGASAAPWIHLYATTLLLFVVLPRTLLAVAAGLRSRALAARFPLALDGLYFERLRVQAPGGRTLVQVLPHAGAVGPQAVLGLRALLATAFGDGVQVDVAPVTPFGDEDTVATIAAPPGTRLRIALFDLAAMPEAESQGRFIAALRGPPALLLMADEAAFRRRFGSLPGRLAERRAAWRKLADANDAALLCADLDAPDPGAAARELQITLAALALQ